jgi:hypothetical protein
MWLPASGQMIQPGMENKYCFNMQISEEPIAG